VFLAGCATTGLKSAAPAAVLISDTHTTASLRNLPPLRKPLDVAVYEFADLTGQVRPNPDFAESSRAVTQGGAQILVDVLSRVGDGSWFRIAERTGLRNLVQERTLIENTKSRLWRAGAAAAGSLRRHHSRRRDRRLRRRPDVG